MKNISILGSTGSIGTQTLEIVSENNDIKVISLTANTNIDLLEEQAIKFEPIFVVVMDKVKAKELKKRIGKKVKVLAGMDGLIEAATHKSIDIVVTAVVGMIGLKPTVEAIKMGKDIALANKETLVTAGELIMKLVKKHGVKMLPVDSEHSAIFQCLNGEKHKTIDKIWLTASGGPFRGKSVDELEKTTLEEALAHPNWSMGSKITIDSATMMNKGLEVIEAKWLFDIDINDIRVVVHPQSIIHSMVEFNDSSVIAQLGLPDMKLPIQYALYYPERKLNQFKRLDLAKMAKLTFEDPDLKTFKCLALAYKALEIGKSMPVVLNAANELAVKLFLGKKITFLEISQVIEFAMEKHEVIEMNDVDEIIDLELWTYKIIGSRWQYE